MNNALVPINEINAEKNALRIYKRQRSKFKMVKFVVFLLFAVFAIMICFNFDMISAIFTDKTLETNTDSSNTFINTETNTNKDPVNAIPTDTFEIIEETFVFSTITNQTDFELGTIEYNPKKANEIYQKYGKEAPVALIIHSACLEAYSNGVYYSTNDEFFSNSENVREIGKAMASKLTSLGVNTIHIDNILANGGIYSSKDEYNAILKATLEKYPSIEYVFDKNDKTYV